MVDKTLTPESMQKMKDVLDRGNKESLRWMTGMNIVENSFLPPGTVMVMVSPDVNKTVCAMREEPLEERYSTRTHLTAMGKF